MKTGRNDPCSCGSGKKYKNCCLNKKVTIAEPILLIFGAGASLGSKGLNHLPPSSTTLYKTLSDNYVTWKDIPVEISKIFTDETFENGMRSLYMNETSESQYNVANLLCDMAIFFSRFTIDNPIENLYCKLFRQYKNQIEQRKIILSTLNYDCLIELALSSQGIYNINYLGNDPTVIKLLKLHGSCNFIPQGITRNRLNSRLIISRGTLNVDFNPVEPSLVEKSLDTAPFAVMSLYTREKNNIACPNQIKTIQADFQQCTNRAKLIISIGVRPDSQDNHIWDYVSASNADLFFVGNTNSCQDWIDNNRHGRGKVLGHSFDNHFHDICNLLDRYL